MICFWEAMPVWRVVLIAVLVIWDLVWRAFALWRAARRGQKAWFVCLMIFNTVGILPIIYLLITRKKGRDSLV